MSLYDQLGQKNPMQEIQNLRADPISYLKNRGFNIPQGMTNPGQITQYLLRSGQVGNNRYQMAMRMLGRK